jgi:hypothetical protein
MSANLYTTMIATLASELAALSTDYAGLVVSPMVFRQAAIPTFARYSIVIAPATRPWDEKRVGIRLVQYIFRADLYLLCKSWDPEKSLFGTATGEKGIFELIKDVKDLLRMSTLGGLLDKTYDEPGGDAMQLGAGGVEFEEVAAGGFDSAEHTFIHRAKILYQGRMHPFCHDT